MVSGCARGAKDVAGQGYPEFLLGIHPIAKVEWEDILSPFIVPSDVSERAVILVAEDEEDYVLLLKLAFFRANIENAVYFVSTGRELVSYLKGDDKYADRDEFPLPDLLLLDLKLPGYNGFEVLAWVKSHPGLTGLRILVLTSSNQLKDINEAYRLGANSFLVKPCDFEDLVHLAKLIQEYWLERAKTPKTFRGEPEPSPVGSLDKSDNIDLLEKSFSPEDWQYLIQNGTFQEHLSSQNETIQAYEELVEIGSLLLIQRQDLRGSIEAAFSTDTDFFFGSSQTEGK